MEKHKVYEYIVVDKDWFGNLEKGSRLYYDYVKGCYVFHTEYENHSKGDRYESYDRSSTDYYISVEKALHYIENGALEPGPELGELENKKSN